MSRYRHYNKTRRRNSEYFEREKELNRKIRKFKNGYYNLSNPPCASEYHEMDVLRREIKNGTELGKTAKGYIDNGQLIPDDLMVSILASVYDSFGREHKGVIFDGFPRTIPQAEALKKMLDERGDKVAAMIELDVPEDELMKRLILRGQQSGRADDNEETIKKRLVVYHSQTQPLIEWYAKEGLHHHINGLGELDRIFADICNVVDGI